MRTPRIMVVFGTRPDAIKLSPLMKILESDPAFDFIPIDTGQHEKRVTWETLKFFGVQTKPMCLDVMRPGQTPNDVLHKTVAGISEEIELFHPDIIIVQGDTTSALAAALSAFNLGIPVAHVEAGLRTWDIHNPWPEESNRLCIDRISDMLFVPTLSDFTNLRRENIEVKKEMIVGNTSVDAQLFCCQRIIEEDFNPRLLLDSETKYVFLTVHRRENFGQPLMDICEAVCEIASMHQDIIFIWPVHPNPKVRETVNKSNLTNQKNVIMYEPFDYMTSMFMIGMSLMVMTDSGGVQEEAAGFAVPTLVFREKTDRIEHEAAGRSRDRAMLLDYMTSYKDKVKVVGHDKELIIKSFESILKKAIERKEKQDISLYKIFGSFHPLYGDGLASQRIAAHLRRKFGMEPDLFPDPAVFQS